MTGVVVGVDDSETARRAAQRAAVMAETLGEPLHLVMAVKPGVTRTIEAGGDTFVADWVAAAETELHAIKKKAGIREATVTVGGKDPAKAICEKAAEENASVIVVGNRRVQGVTRVLGAIAADVLKQAPCDVLVAHTKAEGPTRAD